MNNLVGTHTNSLTRQQSEKILSAAYQDPNSKVVVLQEYSPMHYNRIIGDYRGKDASAIWAMGVTKRLARQATITEAKRDSYVSVGPVDRDNLAGLVPQNRPDVDLPGADSGEDIKSVGGIIEYSDFGNSLQRQQQEIYGNLYEENIFVGKDELYTGYVREMNRQLVSGNAASNPLEFNGIQRLVPSSNIVPFDSTSAESSNILVHMAMRSVITKASSDRNIDRKIDFIIGSLVGHNYILNQMDQNNVLYNRDNSSVVPGINVTHINVFGREIPLTSDKWIDDIPGATNSDPDTLVYYLYGKKNLQWHGVIPFGKRIQKTLMDFEPHITEIYVTTPEVPFLKQEACLSYGALYAANAGRDLYRLEVTVPPGTIARGG